ncbi:molybdopterin converting factor subunit 1 [Luteithermobacter gelatinilyticus]|uniref:molybdopterin converting factor subunit 1 n=1 Tax=Luteithermobacter gelatinilyticus TaxID=2582913 RepID=UPI001106E18C|nr:molybdopterin converting factor subunit 1 [Luteithermobacter gelatinilyticus]|tara:strand:+ start:13367 stop:13618 length:252 start_codon:yes stop_codon:yes gene_type:complete
MRLLYFARIKEQIGQSEEDLPLPANVRTVADLLDYLRSRGEHYRRALADESRIRLAVNQVYVTPDHEINEADEVAIFPPMTGG